MQNVPPVNRTATPMQKRNLISAAIVFRSLFLLERGGTALNPLSLSAGSGLFVLGVFCTASSVFTLIGIQEKGLTQQILFCVCKLVQIN